ncbi:HesA/MoeB/ThiF family protein [Desulfobotulus mexicanus]|uniref:HesA/MoeB/ThiF family protein n=1 Tax=Desulfobotulus mexicanus TaxID=2586642 RepID=A0A5Q4VIY8_9BACT|nr:HesA/MoeB/ThiF family protein [Desulfobotulus mexicanus]TYT75941.1 HesA/MoeB/ThiF family protein [Desulfobotulus mexicanus]
MMNPEEWILRESDKGYLSFEKQIQMEKRFGLSRREAEKFVLEMGLMPERYIRNPWDANAQKKLLNSTLAIVGCGALGSALLEQLLRLGAGVLKVMDPDVFAPSNLNRQMLLKESDLGRPKVEVAARRAADVNPALDLIPVQDIFCERTAGEFLDGVDLVLDALDNIPDRIFLEKACGARGITLIHGAISGWAGQVAVCRPGEELLSGVYGRAETHGGKAAGNPVFGVAVTAGLQVSLGCRVLMGEKTGTGPWFLDFSGPEWVNMEIF